MQRMAPRELSALLWLSLPLVIMVGMSTGAVKIPIDIIIQHCVSMLFRSNGTDLSSGQIEIILFDIRLPRLCLAFLVGVVLAISGAVMQGLFRNPLAAPSLIGVSSGASLGASLVIVFAGAWLQSNSILGLSLIAYLNSVHILSCL